MAPKPVGTDEDHLVRVPALAKEWDCSPSTVYRMIASGKLPAIRFPDSDTVRVRRSDARKIVALAQ
jgi:excisionase family DNA binding protein